MVGWNTLLRLMQEPVVNSNAKVAQDACADDSQQSPAVAQIHKAGKKELRVAVAGCEAPCCEGPFVIEEDDPLDIAPSVTIAQAVTLLLALSKASGHLKPPGSLPQDTRI
jgi:hypothetical protein